MNFVKENKQELKNLTRKIGLFTFCVVTVLSYIFQEELSKNSIVGWISGIIFFGLGLFMIVSVLVILFNKHIKPELVRINDKKNVK